MSSLSSQNVSGQPNPATPLQQFCLRWNNHQPNFVSVFASLLNSESLVDVTLAAEGRHVQAHKVVLSACSSYFQSLFAVNPCQHPIVILKDVKYRDLKTVVDFMYYGEVNVTQEQLANVLKAAEMLKIKGLAEVPEESLPGSAKATPERYQLHPHQVSTSSIDSTRGNESLHHQISWGSSEGGERLHSVSLSHSPSPSPIGGAGNTTPPHKRLRMTSAGSHSSSIEKNNTELATYEVQITSEHRHPTMLHQQQPIIVKSESICMASQEHTTDDEDDRRFSSQESSGTQDGSLSTPEVTTPRDDRHRQLVQQKEFTRSTSVSSTASVSSAPATSAQVSMKNKRGRLLMRQSRVKKDSDMHIASLSVESDVGASTSPFLTVPRIEKQASEPPMSYRASPPPPTTLTVSSPSVTLMVPATTPILQKQRSQPAVMPSDSPSSPVGGVGSGGTQVHRQMSQPATLNLPHIQITQPQQQLQISQKTLGKLQLRVLQPGSSSESSSSATPEACKSPSIIIEQYPLVRMVSAPSEASSDNSAKSKNTGSKPTPIRPKGEGSKTESPGTDSTSRSGHCPVLRQGPALGCNFCWNTVDAHGRILRRKTKYCCPDCQINLCIVPCFQHYHQRFEQKAAGSKELSEEGDEGEAAAALLMQADGGGVKPTPKV